MSIPTPKSKPNSVGSLPTQLASALTSVVKTIRRLTGTGGNGFVTK